jgi:hypothetical protein
MEAAQLLSLLLKAQPELFAIELPLEPGPSPIHVEEQPPELKQSLLETPLLL